MLGCAWCVYVCVCVRTCACVHAQGCGCVRVWEQKDSSLDVFLTEDAIRYITVQVTD